MHDICVRIYVRLLHQSSCAGSPIELYLVTYGLTLILITSKTESNIKKTSLHVKTVYQTHRNIHRFQDGDEDKSKPLNIKITCGNITYLHEVTPLKIKIISGNTKGIRPLPKINE